MPAELHAATTRVELSPATAARAARSTSVEGDSPHPRGSAGTSQRAGDHLAKPAPVSERGRHHRGLRLAARIALVVVGLAPVVYGIARFSGGWLGVPPRWMTKKSDTALFPHDDPPPSMPDVITMIGIIESPFGGFEPGARDFISLGMIALGTSLIVTGVRARRRRPIPTM